jgi:Mrp family chromosome partitioning ATPase
MAAVLAQGGKKVALVDTDMRRPSVYKRLRLEGGKGLSEVLTGYYTLDEVTQTHETLTTLDVIPWVLFRRCQLTCWRRTR